MKRTGDSALQTNSATVVISSCKNTDLTCARYFAYIFSLNPYNSSTWLVLCFFILFTFLLRCNRFLVNNLMNVYILTPV